MLDGVALPRDPADEELGTIVTGVAAPKVLARYTANDNPAVIAGDVPADLRRMVTNATTGGTQYASIVECNAATANAKARPFQLQWGTTPKMTFKVTSYRHVSCLNDPAVPGAPNGFDTQTGDADGTLDGVAGHRIEWSIVDGGAMSADRIQARIVRVSDGTVLRTISGAPTAGIGHFASAPSP